MRKSFLASKSLKKVHHGSSCRNTVEMNPTRNHEVAGSIPGLTRWVKDLLLLWLWCRPTATAPIRPLACEPPYAATAALKSKKKKQLITTKLTRNVKKILKLKRWY